MKAYREQNIFRELERQLNSKKQRNTQAKIDYRLWILSVDAHDF